LFTFQCLNLEWNEEDEWRLTIREWERNKEWKRKEDLCILRPLVVDLWWCRIVFHFFFIKTLCSESWNILVELKENKKMPSRNITLSKNLNWIRSQFFKHDIKSNWIEWILIFKMINSLLQNKFKSHCGYILFRIMLDGANRLSDP
jgi:hypothetical protein